MRDMGHKERGLNWSHLPALFAGRTPWGQLFSVLLAGHLRIRLYVLRILWKEISALAVSCQIGVSLFRARVRPQGLSCGHTE